MILYFPSSLPPLRPSLLCPPQLHSLQPVLPKLWPQSFSVFPRHTLLLKIQFYAFIYLFNYYDRQFTFSFLNFQFSSNISSSYNIIKYLLNICYNCGSYRRTIKHMLWLLGAYTFKEGYKDRIHDILTLISNFLLKSSLYQKVTCHFPIFTKISIPYAVH